MVPSCEEVRPSVVVFEEGPSVVLFEEGPSVVLFEEGPSVVLSEDVRPSGKVLFVSCMASSDSPGSSVSGGPVTLT